MTEQKKYKFLPEGIESFSELINEGCYYVDKTPYIKTIFEEGKKSVLLFTRPRRFGKTLFMSMLADFLRINRVNPENKEKTKELFKDTQILKDQEFTDKFLGNFPVFNISLKRVFGSNYIDAYKQLAELIAEKARELIYLNESDKLQDEEKQIFKKLQKVDFLREIENNDYLTNSIKTICDLLYKHFNKPVIVLIDEYDVPLARAAENGYHKDMVSLISSFLNFMKAETSVDDGSKSIYKIIMTGCLKVAKNSIFTGVNNLRVNTVLDDDDKFSSMIGFTKAEVIKMLNYYDMSDYEAMVKDNYDGYKFNNDEMFCPWDVVNFIADNYQRAQKNEKVEAKNYWNGSSSASSTIIKDYLVALSDSNTKILQTLQDLVDGKCIDVSINDSMNYDSLEMHKADDFYSLLLHTGYLTSVGKVKDDIYTVKIPNKEIYDCFKRNIMSFFEDCVIKKNTDNVANIITNALLKGDCNTALAHIRKIISQYVSVRDFATKAYKENYYHALLNGIFACATNIQNYRTNSEAGDGFADIIFESSDGTKAVIIELKLASEQNHIVPKAQEAIAQIKEKKYANAYANNLMITDVYCYGISFFAKNCYMLADSKE